jgi:DNA-binding GntR family transcriptional regulator
MNARKENKKYAINQTASSEMMAAEYIRNAIIQHRLQPRQKIVQEEISQELGISRVPVREALKRLETEGWVISDHGRGFVVESVTLDDVYEIHCINTVLEGLAAKEVAKSTDKEGLSEAAGILRQMKDVTSLQEWYELNEQFHLSIYRQAGMNRLFELIKRYRLQSSRMIYMYISQSLNLKKANKEHKNIFSAVMEGRSDDAERLTVEHLSETREGTFRMLKSFYRQDYL